MGKLEEDIKVLWDLETLGIAESDRVYAEFVDNIMFNGNRYSVELPQKAGRDILDGNYELSLSRMKAPIKKLRNDPEA